LQYINLSIFIELLRDQDFIKDPTSQMFNQIHWKFHT